jgi:hypothetical protein
MGDEGPPLRLLEDEREGVEGPGRAHPSELVGTPIHLRLEVLRVALAEAAVDAVGDDHQIRVRKQALVVDVDLVAQGHAQFRRAVPEDQEQGPARAAAEAVSADPVHRVLEVDRNVVPIGEFAGDPLVARKVVLLEVVEGRVREDDTEAEGVVGPVALVDRDVRVRPLLLQQDREIKPRWAAADDRRLHVNHIPEADPML